MKSDANDALRLAQFALRRAVSTNSVQRSIDEIDTALLEIGAYMAMLGVTPGAQFKSVEAMRTLIDLTR